MALEGLGEKLKSFFKPKEDARFKGQGRRLGTPEVRRLAKALRDDFYELGRLFAGSVAFWNSARSLMRHCQGRVSGRS